MDWLKLFALLVAVASVQITAEGPKKKIRIHLPQKVKHIHHHKKIYITNHPAPSQYAPAYMPGVKGSVALPSNIARPAVASIVPLNSMELYDEARSRLPGISQAASKLLPLYRARGHYGPHHSEWEEHEFDVASPPEPNDIYTPSGYSAPPAHVPAPVAPTKKYKVVKVKSDAPRKKVLKKINPKRVLVRDRQPQPVLPHAQAEEEHPVSSFHEQFYSDLEEAGTIRKVKKPPRIEKIIDGDTEHIHTYSEEHIHKVVFDDDSKVTGVVGVDPIGSMSALNAAHPLIPLKNAQTLVAIPTNYADLTVMGSMGTPSHLEYASYNPRDVTHDHIFHDHGEISQGVDISKESLRIPPKISYNNHGLRVQGNSAKRFHGKRYSKPTKPTHDFSYYESFYAPANRPKKVLKPTIPTPHYDNSAETTVKDFRPIPAFRFNDKRNQKYRTYGYNNLPNFQLQQASVPAPFSVSTTVVHDYDHKGYGASGPAPTGFSKYSKESSDFRDSYSSDADYDAFASSTNIHTSEDKTDTRLSHQGKHGKKSVSKQNISFGGQGGDRETFVDHLAVSASNNDEVSISQISPTAMEQFKEYHEANNAATPTPYTIKETSPAHPYYKAMALKALHTHGHGDDTNHHDVLGDHQPEETTQPTEITEDASTTTQTLHFYQIQSTDAIPEPEYISESRPSRKRKEKNKNEYRQRYNAVFKDLVSGYTETDQESHGAREHDHLKYFRSSDSSSVRGNPQYGDKI